MINSGRLIDIFFQLVRIDSPTGSENNITKFIVGFLDQKKLVDEIKVDSFGNVYARINGNGSKEAVFFSDHLDTVEPGRCVEPLISGQYIVSKGDTVLGADDKSSVASILEMLCVLKEQKLPHRPIEFIFTISEEVGNLGAVNFDYSLLKAKKGFCFDCSWELGTVVTASPFYERFNIVITGKSAHASRPELGQNVLPAAGKILSKLRFGVQNRDTILNIGVVQSGSVRNTIPGQIRLEGEIRSFSERKINSTRENLLKVIEKVVQKYDLQYENEVVRENPGFKLNQTKIAEIIKELTPAFQSLNIKTNPVEIWSVSDTNIFMQHGLTCINLGSGREFAHTTRERIKIKTLENLSAVMLNIAKSI